VTIADLLADGFGRIRDVLHRRVEGLTLGESAFRTDCHANSIAWLLCHLARVQDDHMADIAAPSRSGARGGGLSGSLPLHPSATGYGKSPDELGGVRVESADLLTGYHAFHEQTLGFLRCLTEVHHGCIVEESWDPSVSLGAPGERHVRRPPPCRTAAFVRDRPGASARRARRAS
jgi:hypothetical protein